MESNNETGTALAPMDLVRADALKEINLVEQGLADLSSKYKDVVFDCKTTTGMADAKVARAAIREPRYQVERARKKKKSELAQIGKDLDSKCATVTAALEALEDPIHAQISAEEKRKETEKLQKAEDERRRTSTIRAMIDAIRNTEPARNVSSLEIAVMNLSVMEIAEEGFHEFVDEALAVRESTVERLKAIRDELVEIERQRDELKAQAEAQRLAAEQLALERQKIESDRAEQDRLRLEQQASEDEARAKQQAEDDRIRRIQHEADEVARRHRKAADDYISGIERIVLRASTADSASIQATITNLDIEELNLAAHQDEADAAHTKALADLRILLDARLKIEAEAAEKAAQEAQAAAQRAEEAEAAQQALEAAAAAQREKEETLRREQAELDRKLADLAAKQEEEARSKVEAEMLAAAQKATENERLAHLQSAVETYLKTDMLDAGIRRAALAVLRSALTFSRGGK